MRAESGMALESDVATVAGHAAASLLAGVYAHDRHAHLQTTVEDALRAGMAEGRAGMLAINAERHGYTIAEADDGQALHWTQAYDSIYAELANLADLPLMAQAWVRTLVQSGIGTELKASGSSGNWPTPPYDPGKYNAMTPVDLRDVNDVTLLVSVGNAGGTSPSMKVGLDVFDDQGNLYPNIIQTAAIAATGQAAPVYAGAHGAATAFVIFPSWGRVNWVITGTNPDSPETIRSYRSLAENHIFPRWGGQRADRLLPEHIEDGLADMPKHSLGPASVRRSMRCSRPRTSCRSTGGTSSGTRTRSSSRRKRPRARCRR